MPAKKESRTSAISDSDILAIYEEIVPLLSNNREAFQITDRLNAILISLVYYDFSHYIMESSDSNQTYGKLGMDFERWKGFKDETDGPAVSIQPSTLENWDNEFEESVAQNYESAVARRKASHPEVRDYDYHRISSDTHPRIVLGFFRRKDIPAKGFTREEKKIFDRLAPHLIALYRAVLYQVSLSQGFQYFNAFSQIGSKLASDYHLSDSEVRLLPDILFGLNNEAIAEKHFISVETVKSHIKHILKKTGTKNRIDFIGKFFTSPERVQL